MGFFSWCCAKFGHPVLGFDAVERTQRALCEVVLLLDDRVITGTYDGYGRVDDYEIPCGRDPVMLHRCCYRSERVVDPPASVPDPGQGFCYGKQDSERILAALALACAGGKPEPRQRNGGA